MHQDLLFLELRTQQKTTIIVQKQKQKKTKSLVPQNSHSTRGDRQKANKQIIVIICEGVRGRNGRECAVLYNMVREGLSDEEAFQQRPEAETREEAGASRVKQCRPREQNVQMP